MISSTILSSMFEHFGRCAPREGCGVLAVKKGKLKWLPCTNIAQDDDDFALDPDEYIKIYHTHDVVGIVHSHVNSSCEPSETCLLYTSPSPRD